MPGPPVLAMVLPGQLVRRDAEDGRGDLGDKLISEYQPLAAAVVT